MRKPGSLDEQILHNRPSRQSRRRRSGTPARVGSVVVTEGGAAFPAANVFHAIALHLRITAPVRAAGAGARSAQALWACFRRAHEMRLRSLALPAMGTSSGASAEDVARMLCDVTHTYLMEFRPPLEQVYFVLRDRAIWINFREAATERGMLLV